jgi:hypothetical protein
MTGVQVFLMAFGAILALIGVVVFFLLAWFKETTGQDQHNAIKILQAEFRFSNPSLVIFAGGLLLMVAPFFIVGNAQGGSPPPSAPVAMDATPSIAATSLAPAVAQELVAVPVAAEPTPTDTPEPSRLEPTPTIAPPVSPTAAPTTVVPTVVLTVVPIVVPPEPTGRWWNQTGFLEFRRMSSDTFAYSDFDGFGNQVGQGTATQDGEYLDLSGEGYLFDGFGNPYYVAYTGEMFLDGDILNGDLYDTFGSYLGSVLFTRESGGMGQ